MTREDTPLEGLPLTVPTPDGWARIAAGDLATFLADHAICEQQAALTALNLIAHYPEDEELVERMTSLAVEEVIHLRRVSELLRRRGLRPARRRSNPWVSELRSHVRKENEAQIKVDRLLVGALIEARSCERFTRLLDELRDTDPEVASLLRDLGPAEKRHWEIFYRLAARDQDREGFERRWSEWLEVEARATRAGGKRATVHG
jgi:tRNA-(ms[2]io[6]A)-hydroxylase